MICRKVRYSLIILLSFSLISTKLISQNSLGIQWQRCLTFGNTSYAKSLLQLSNEDLILFGSSPIGVIGLVRMDKDGIIKWRRGYDNFSAGGISQTQDGGFIITGGGPGNCITPFPVAGSPDMWVIKVDSNGYEQWRRCYGGSNSDYGVCIKQIANGNYILAGNTYSNDFNIIGAHGDRDVWIAELNSSGSILSSRCLGGTSYEGVKDLKLTPDGGFVIAGTTYSNDGDFHDNH